MIDLDHALLRDALGLGVAGNFAGHLEQVNLQLELEAASVLRQRVYAGAQLSSSGS